MNSAISRTVTGISNLCLLRGSPSVLPYSYNVLALFVLTEFCLSIINLQQIIPTLSVGQLISVTLFARSMLLGLLYMLLNMKKYQTRFVKLVIALFGTHLVQTAILYAFITLFSLPDVLKMAFLIWGIAVNSYILKLTLEIKMARAILIMFGIYLIVAYLTGVILGPQLDTPL